MSIFERKLINKVYLDDTISLSATIINAETIQGHTEYVIQVQRGCLPENSWHVQRRYNDFLCLHQILQSDGVNLPLPPKKLIGNLEREFVAQRQAGLQKYLDLILEDCFLSCQPSVKKFLDPQNYNSYHGLGHTQMCVKLRGEPEIKINKQLPCLGWRFRKEHYSVTLEENNKEECILHWIPFGPDKYLDDKQILALLKSYAALQHANIMPILKVGICQDGGWVLRKVKKGSLLDIMYSVKSPHTTSALKKYRNVQVNAIPLSQVLEIASQIIQALAFLHHKGVYYGHLHLGNIMLDGNSVKLADLENSLFGLPSFYRESFIKVRQIQSMQALDVYSLGLVMYEMLFGKRFDEFNSKIASCPPILRNVLESILCLRSKETIPTIAQLLNNQIFRGGPPAPTPYLKISSNLKQCLVLNSTKLLERLKDDQIKYRQVKRTKKMYGLLNDESKLVVCIKDKRKPEKHCEINGNIDISIQSGSISSKDSSKNSGSSEEKTKSPSIETDGRTALLGAICNFNKNNLKKTNTKT